MLQQSDLFSAPAPLPGFNQRDGFLIGEEEQALIARIDATALTPFRFQGWLGKRLTISFGWRYDFENASFGPTQAIPEWLTPLRDRAAAFAGLAADDLV